MKELYELRDLVCDELEEYGKKGEISMGNLDVIDKLSHTLKSLETIIAMKEADGGNSEYYPMYRSYDSGRNNSYTGHGSSYARGRKRDSMGRYSRDEQMDGMVEQLRDLMNDAPNDRVRSELQKVVNKMENM